MTSNSDPVDVVQADRDAAEELTKGLVEFLRSHGHKVRYLDGPEKCDDEIVMAFARHRLAHAAPPSPPASGEHPDDIAVDRFAAAMRAKMAKSRAAGRSGWDDPVACPVERLAAMLIDHVGKGDPVDIGNFAMMLFNREGWHSRALLAAAPPQAQDESKSG